MLPLLDQLETEQQFATQTLFGVKTKIIGIDEVGRGCLAGPVVAAAVHFHSPADFPHDLSPMIKDSKALSRAQRLRVYSQLRKCCKIGLAQVSAAEIDRLNVLAASLLAMRYAVHKLFANTGGISVKRHDFFALIDGNQAPETSLPQRCVVQGDKHCVSIAAASIVAKTVRDRLMLFHHHRYPMYHWHRNAGYGTRVHIQALSEHGITRLHRRSFRPVAEVMSRCSG